MKTPTLAELVAAFAADEKEKIAQQVQAHEARQAEQTEQLKYQQLRTAKFVRQLREVFKPAQDAGLGCLAYSRWNPAGNEYSDVALVKYTATATSTGARTYLHKDTSSRDYAIEMKFYVGAGATPEEVGAVRFQPGNEGGLLNCELFRCIDSIPAHEALLVLARYVGKSLTYGGFYIGQP